MNILAYADIHGNPAAINALRKKAKKADIAICAGDFTVFGARINQIIRQLDSLGRKTLLIHGNHEDEQEVEQLCSKTRNITYIHGKNCRVEHNGQKYLVIGYGGGGFSLRDKGFERFASRTKPKQDESLILVTHAPPHNTKLDMLWEHRGRKSITDFIKKAKPALAICGHFHENFGKQDKLGQTRIVNPGPKGMVINLHY
ncbi:metallophosphoesterase family protein [Candidatus Woesearchaeota archaeon]|nr:metallophosphoesterase family protein [Candidatus Woesearchaeota archaeon]